MASSSSFSSSTPSWKYDVFLSFRGEETRNTFTDHLYDALNKKGIITFRDEEKLETGKSISSALFKAIEDSRIALVVLSKNYASSTWCLDELQKIVDCMKEKGMTVLPVFYDVDPSDVRKQLKTFEKAFVAYEERFMENMEKVEMWKNALTEVANLKGWHLVNRPESKIIQNIVEDIWHKLSYAFSECNEGKVGIISRGEKLVSLLSIGSNDVRIIGLWGMGGIGKTTLARVVFRMVSEKFESCCFLSNVREESEKSGLVRLQQLLILKLLNESMSIHDVDDGVFTIKNRLRHKRILLILDDVDQLGQLDNLAGNHIWFGSGSRIIITTRDRHLLRLADADDIYDVEGLDDGEALHLLSLKAFKTNHPPKDFLELSKDVVHYAKGLPLAIETLGSFLFNRGVDIWKDTLKRLKEFPETAILQKLKISYEGLQETEKKIFLYIACFFNHEEKNIVVETLDYLDLFPYVGLRVLVDKSLIKMNEFEVCVHDLLQEMCQEIVREECREDPGKRSILWSFEDINNVLKNNTGTEAIQGMALKLPELKEANWNPESFSKMRHLKFLRIDNVHLLHDPKHLPDSLRVLIWSGYSSKSLPSSLHLTGLSLRDRIYNIDDPDDPDFKWRYEIFIPGSLIPKWFSHQSMGDEVHIKEPSSHLFTNEWMGIAVCVVFHFPPHHQNEGHHPLDCLLIVNGNYLCATPSMVQEVYSSDQIWLLYLSNQYFKEREEDIKILKECEANEFSQIGIEIGTSNNTEVKKCGFRMVYKKDIEDLNQTMSQSSNTSIIPYEDFGVLHHNSDNSMVVGDGNIAKRTCDGYDGAGPSGEGSSNDMPNPKRIERLPEFKTHGNSDCPGSSE